MNPLRPGDPAPDFSLPDARGETVNLRDLRGRPVYLLLLRAPG